MSDSPRLIEECMRPRSRRWAIACAISIICVVSLLPAVQAADSISPPSAKRLVAQLGHDEFAVRERAAASLIGLKVRAEPALRAGLLSNDREIRDRSRKLLSVILELDLRDRFEKFKQSTDPQQDYGLPGWEEYRDSVGYSAAARSLFVTMQQQEKALLEMVNKDRRRLSKALADRCEQVRQQAMFNHVDVSLGTTAALLFAATRDDVSIAPTVPIVLWMICRAPNFETAVGSGPGRKVLATLANEWIQRHPRGELRYGLYIGVMNNLDAALPRAREVFDGVLPQPDDGDPRRQGDPPIDPMPRGPQVINREAVLASDQINACLCIAKFGDASDIERVERYLEDVRQIDQDQVDGQVVVTQIRDLALAVLVKLSDQDLKQFGFDRVVYDRRFVFHLPSLGFRDEQSREQAIEAWRAYQLRAADGRP